MDATSLNESIGRRVRAQRVAQGRSLGDLARASGLSKTILSKIESGSGNPSVETLWRLSQALAVPLGTLLEGDVGEPRTRLIRRRSGPALSAESGMASWTVYMDGRGRRTELHELAFAAGVEHRSDAHLPGTEEVVLCLSGRLRLGPDGEQETLEAGDALWFASDGPHSYLAVDGEARVLCWMLYEAAAP
jgi:XRE family transcriptional regulator, regulator of sulfur utilization